MGGKGKGGGIVRLGVDAGRSVCGWRKRNGEFALYVPGETVRT